MPTIDPGELASRVYELSAQAFDLARAVAAGHAPADAAEQARHVRLALVDLAEGIEAASDLTLRAARSEAMVDLNYVASGGTAPLSLRLNQVLPRPDASPEPEPADDLED